jgi:hypothetical protein
MPKNGSALRSGFCRHPLVKADIHFPVDRVLLRDAARTLVEALLLIREHGLKHRSGSPEALIRSMNKLCMEMTHTRKKKEVKEVRKKIFRRMKRLMKPIEQHGGRYHALLEENREQTVWSRA